MKSSKNTGEQGFTLAPASVPQEQFLETTSNITLYSGSAGAGKTFAIILMLVKYAMRQNTTAVVFRRTSTQIRQNGGIWQEATQVFKKMFGKGCIIKSRDLEIYIPATNATIKFSHLQHQSDISNHLGAQYSVK
jgi:phage terminase large subunit